MSIFHYKAELIESKDEGTSIYRFYPDYFMAPEVFGKFSTSVSNWEPVIIEPAGTEENKSNRRPVLMLTVKIMNAYEAEAQMPKTVYHIA